MRGLDSYLEKGILAMKIAILYICTGKYEIFWEEFYKSFEEYFIKDALKEYFVFTDAEHIYQEDNEKVHKLFQKNLGWPDNTLKRFSIFLKAEDQLKRFDYIFFFNANAKCCKEITGQELLPKGSNKLIVVQHPGFFNKKNDEFPYERNAKSLACIPAGEGECYVCGGVNGGYTANYLELINCLAKNIQEDKRKKIVAAWHDESHLNKYIIGRKDVKILSPAYCFPEGYDIPFEKKIMMRDKSKVLDLKKIKGADKLPINIWIKVVMKRILKTFGIKVGS